MQRQMGNVREPIFFKHNDNEAPGLLVGILSSLEELTFKYTKSWHTVLLTCSFFLLRRIEEKVLKNDTKPSLFVILSLVLILCCHPPVLSEIASLLSKLKRILRLSPVSLV